MSRYEGSSVAGPGHRQEDWESEVTKGGIIIPDTAKEKPQQGKVVSVGKGKIMDDGSRLERMSRPANGAVRQVCRHRVKLDGKKSSSCVKTISSA